jgi:hypothetical protein
MIGHIIAALFGLALTWGGLSTALAFNRGGVWRWVDRDVVHTMVGTHPPEATRVAPHPIWYSACAGVVSFGVLLILYQIPPWEGWAGRALFIDLTSSLGLATSIAGAYMMGRAALAWRDKRGPAEAGEDDPEQLRSRDEAAERDVEIDLDIAGKATENATHFLLGLLPAGLRATAIGAILLTTGVSAFVALSQLVRGNVDKRFLESAGTAPAIATLLILALIVAWTAAVIIFGIFSLTGMPSWACAGVTASLVLGSVFVGLVFGFHPSWTFVTHLALRLFGD